MESKTQRETRAEALAREIDAPLSEVRNREYSFLRALHEGANGDNRGGPGFEGEVNQALMHKHGAARGFWLPETILRSALSVDGAGTGAELALDMPIDEHDALRPLASTGRLGATFVTVSGMRSAVLITFADGSIAWIGESETVTDSNGTTGAVTVERKTVRAKNTTTRQLESESSSLARADRMTIRSLAGSVAAEIDRVALNGSGAANVPLGILKTPGIGSVALGDNGGAPTYSAICQLEETIALANAESAHVGFATTPQARRKLRTTEKATGSGFIWGDNGLLGYQSVASTAIPSTLTKGSGENLSAILCGDFAQLYVVRFGPLDILTDPFSRGDNGEVVYRVFAGIGIGASYATAFAAITDAVTTV